jgi:hypothetical protein
MIRCIRRLDGLKTEPAIAKALGLDGDPYQAVEHLSDVTDHDLHRLLMRVPTGTRR